MKKSLLFSISTFLLLAFLLSGCGKLTSPKAMIKEIEEKLPGCEVTSVKESESINTYTVKHKDIEFKVYNELNSDGLFGDYATFSSDYYKEILKEESVQSLIEKYDIYYDEFSDFAKLTAYITDSEGLRKIYDFLEELSESIFEYLPEEDFYSEDLSVSVYYLDDENWITTEFIDIRKDYNWDYLYTTSLIEIKADIEASTDDEAESRILSSDFFTNVDYDSIPERFIENLYINSDKFESENEEIKFLYHLADDTYYAKLSINYMNEIEDYLLEEIISAYYPDSNFTIDLSSFVTTYTINSNDYKLYYSNENDRPIFKDEFFNVFFEILSYDEYRLCKNNKKLDISIMNNVDGHGLLGIYIKVEDWAALMEMNVDKIDKNGVYLSTK
ncbi:MAG: hypothetical protein IJZ54_07730 [Clostridia bacterium]|nr:hypothetical protein [Clostridia bacterium]